MKLFSQFGDSTAFALQRAILIYGGSTPHGPTCIATMHDVRTAEGRAEIQPGTCVTQEAVQDLALTLLEQSDRLELLPPTLLAMGIKGMIWHRPAGRRQLWFSPNESEVKKDAKVAALKKVSGDWFPQPHLLFHATPHGLEVFALKGAGKPPAKSPLYQAPYWNINEDGTLCIGTARIPKGGSVSQMAACERGFFESNFTHSNCHGHGLTLFKGGHNALWPALKGKRRFPESTLVPLKNGKKAFTVGDLL